MEMVVFITWKLCDRACMNIQYEIKRVNDVSHILNKMWQEEKKEKKRGKKKEKMIYWMSGAIKASNVDRMFFFEIGKKWYEVQAITHLWTILIAWNMDDRRLWQIYITSYYRLDEKWKITINPIGFDEKNSVLRIIRFVILGKIFFYLHSRLTIMTVESQHTI